MRITQSGVISLFFLVGVTFFSSFYIAFTWMTVPRLVGAVLALFYLAYFLKRLEFPRDRYLMGVFVCWSLFVFYQILLNGLRGDPDYLRHGLNNLYCLAFILFFSSIRPINLGKPLLFVATGLCLFGLYQFFVSPILIDDLVPRFGGLLGTSTDVAAEQYRDLGIEWNYLQNTGRMHGPYTIAVTFSEMLGIIAIIYYIAWRRNGGAVNIAMLALLLVTIYFTYTRSAIFGVIACMVLYEFLFQNTKLKSLLAIYVILALAWGASEVVAQTDAASRVLSATDGNTVIKVVTNWHVSVYTLKNYPIFGFSKLEHTNNVLKAIQESGMQTTYRVDLYVTNHNMLVAYFKHFGIIGLSLVLGVIYFMFRCFLAGEREYKEVGIISLAYLLQFSLLHNTDILEIPLLAALVGSSKFAAVSARRSPYAGSRYGQLPAE